MKTIDKQIESLEKSIKQWKIIYRLAKEDKVRYIIDAKVEALKEMGVDTYIRYKCFLCHEFHDSIERTCGGCPMEGYWPNINKGYPLVRKCFDGNSVYDELELMDGIKPKKVKRILKAMKKRLKELKNDE